MFEKDLSLSLLYDLYSPLLSEKKREVFEAYFLSDLSLAEISEETGTSRQAVHDMVKRCEKLLLGYEEKLHLVERFLNTKDMVKQVKVEIEKLRALKTCTGDAELEIIDRIDNLSGHILEQL